MAPPGRSAAMEGSKAKRSGSIAGLLTPSSSPPSMSPSTSPPSRTHSRQPSGGTGATANSSSRRARAPSVSTPPPDPSSSTHVNQNQSGQDTHGMTPSSIISHLPPATPKSRPIEKKVSASARVLRLGLTMTPTPLVTPTTRLAMRSRAQNILPEHEPSHHCDFFTASRQCSKCREAIKSPRSSVCLYLSFFHSLC